MDYQFGPLQAYGHSSVANEVYYDARSFPSLECPEASEYTVKVIKYLDASKTKFVEATVEARPWKAIRGKFKYEVSVSWPSYGSVDLFTIGAYIYVIEAAVYEARRLAAALNDNKDPMDLYRTEPKVVCKSNRVSGGTKECGWRYLSTAKWCSNCGARNPRFKEVK